MRSAPPRRWRRSCRPRYAAAISSRAAPTVMLSSQEVRPGLDEPLRSRRDQVDARQDPARAVIGHLDRGRAGWRRRLLKPPRQRLRRETEMPVHVAESPLTCGRWLRPPGGSDVLQRSSRPGRSNNRRRYADLVQIGFDPILCKPFRPPVQVIAPRPQDDHVALGAGRFYSTPKVRNASATDMPCASARTASSLADLLGWFDGSPQRARRATTTPSWPPSTKSPAPSSTPPHSTGTRRPRRDPTQGVGAVDSPREGREVHVDQRERVADVGIGYDAARPALPGSRREQLAPEGRVAGRCDEHLAGLQGVDCLDRAAVPLASIIGNALVRDHAHRRRHTGQPHAGSQRADPGASTWSRRPSWSRQSETTAGCSAARRSTRTRSCGMSATPQEVQSPAAGRARRCRASAGAAPRTARAWRASRGC